MTHPDEKSKGEHARRPTCPAPIASRMTQQRQPSRAGLAATLALCAGLLVAARPLPALAANGAALADLARSIHRMQAACERRAHARCELLAADFAMAVDDLPRRAGERDTRRRKAAMVEPPASPDATALRPEPTAPHTN
jgi:hypothetical protein